MSHEEYRDNSVDAVLSRIEARQKANSEKLDEVIAAHTLRFEKVEGQIEAVQKQTWWLSGAAAAVATLATKLFGK